VIEQYCTVVKREGTGVWRGSSKNRSGAQQEAEQQQIKTMQWCN